MGFREACRETGGLLLYGLLDVLFSVLVAGWWSKSARSGPGGTRCDCRRAPAPPHRRRRGTRASLALCAHAWKGIDISYTNTYKFLQGYKTEGDFKLKMMFRHISRGESKVTKNVESYGSTQVASMIVHSQDTYHFIESQTSQFLIVNRLLQFTCFEMYTYRYRGSNWIYSSSNLFNFAV